MSLTLQIENFAVLDDGGPVSLQVPATGLQVGRGGGMGWVLPDASRHISGHHFDVFQREGTWFLQDRSTNGTFLQGHRHRLDGPHALTHGDRFQVGQYLIVALMDAPEDAAPVQVGSLPPYRGGFAAPEPPQREDDFWSVPGGFAPVDPMPRETAPGRGADFAADFVHFPVSTPAAAPEAPAVLPQTALPPDAAGGDGAPPAPTPNPAPAPPADPSAFVAAFCRGAGLSPELAAGTDPAALAEAAGRALAVTAQGLMAGLRDRASARHLTRAGERTMRGATDNNPLKFLPSEQDALEAMFLRPRAGFMAGPEGYGEAVEDLRRHQAALFAAIQPALADLMSDLDPARIEAEAKGGGLGLQGQRKARAWDSFVERWDAKAAHENGILTEFIRLFADAYRAADRH